MKLLTLQTCAADRAHTSKCVFFVLFYYDAFILLTLVFPLLFFYFYTPVQSIGFENYEITKVVNFSVLRNMISMEFSQCQNLWSNAGLVGYLGHKQDFGRLTEFCESNCRIEERANRTEHVHNQSF